ncbi:MAG: tetraacyldisaccharide 4'-kinase [Candidatus Zixiibacteriota bacterium]
MFEALWKEILRRKGLSLLFIPALLLWAIALFYRIGLFLTRTASRGKIKVRLPVISIGNISVGGTGKTPILLTLARFLINEGYKVGIVSSAHGRTGKNSFVKPGYQVSELTIDETGDEVMLLADALPEAIFAVDRSKTRAAQNAANSEFELDLILVDDGFQHFTLHRDMDTVTFDAAVPRGQLKIFPSGILREPMSALNRADVIIITRAKFAKDIGLLREKLAKLAPRAEIYLARFQLGELCGQKQRLPLKYVEDKSVFIFAGIGNFRAFVRQIRGLTRNIDYTLELSDHQIYDEQTLNKIKTLAAKQNSQVLLTTAKDWFKVRHFDFGRELYYLAQIIDIDPGEEKLVSHLLNKIGIKQKVG